MVSVTVFVVPSRLLKVTKRKKKMMRMKM